jgi:hypothetical protein
MDRKIGQVHSNLYAYLTSYNYVLERLNTSQNLNVLLNTDINVFN